MPGEGNIGQLTVKGKPLYLARFKNNYFAGKVKCPHAKGNLAFGKLTEDGEIVCPLHRFKFNLKNGKETSGNGGFCVTTYPVKLATDKQYYIGFLKKKKWFTL